MNQIDPENSFSMRLDKVALIVSGKYVGENITVKGISTDSRSIQGGELFIALKGPNFDGHDFIEQAIKKGAVACLVEREIKSAPFVITENTHDAMGLLAKAWRQGFKQTVIAVTGSNGKTTVKEMIASILSQNKSVLATQGNLNNDIGVPLTLFRLNEKYTAAVIEMGANHSGEIKYLANLVHPDIAVVTNAGAAHLEGFGRLDDVARAKAEIFDDLSDKAFAIINADDEFSDLWKNRAAKHQILTFGVKNAADITAEWKAGAEGSDLQITTPVGKCKVRLKLLGSHNVMNALAAIAATLTAGSSLEQITQGLEHLKPVKGRLEMKKGLNNSRLIDDTYNANPTSVKAAINVLHDFTGKRFLALGDMGELGQNASTLHKEAGLYAKESGVDSLYSYGQLASKAAREFGVNGFCYDKHADLIDALKDELSEDVILLVKGSRNMGMENIVNALTTVEG